MDWNKVGMGLIAIIQVPSFCCAVYILFQFTQRTSPLRRLQNHLLLCLLIVATWAISIELINTEKFFWTGSTIIQTNEFCFYWNISFLSTSSLNRILMALMSIQRHILVFHSQFYHTRRSRLLFHYIPLIFTISSVLIYLFVTNIFVSCSARRFDYSRFMCGYTCTVIMQQLGMVYNWVFVFSPTMITIIGCILLPIRFLIQKRQLQRVQWSRARKMIVQTSTIASAYTLCWLPYAICLQLLFNGRISLTDSDVGRFFAFVPYVTSLLTPFMVSHTISAGENLRLIQRVKRRLFPQRQGVVEPVADAVVNQQNPSALKEHTSNKRLQVKQN